MRTATLHATIARDGTGELEDRRSRFICYLHRVSTEDAAQKFIADIRRRDWDARHHCTALILGPRGELTRSSDDGEPAGTAGAPMLAVLQRAQVTDVLAVVSRYFGGVLLGTGGLVRAYGGAVQAALSEVGLVARRELAQFEIAVPAGVAGREEHAIRHWADQYQSDGALVTDVSYGEIVTVRLAVPPQWVEAFNSWAAARQELAVTASDPIVVEVPRGLTPPPTPG